MKKYELEQKLYEIAKHIGISDLLKKCMTVAHREGKIFTEKDEEDDEALVHRIADFPELNLKIIYTQTQINMLKGVNVDVVSSWEKENYQAERVLTAYERKSCYGMTMVVIDNDRARYEIVKYIKGEWEDNINKLYDKICEELGDDVSPEVLKDVKERYGITNSKE